MSKQSLEDVKTKLHEIICEISERDEIPEETPFKDLGIDSVLALEIVSEVERTWKISIPEDELSKLTHFGAVLELVQQKLDAEA